MVEPTLAETRYFAVHGTFPQSLKDRMKVAKQKVKVKVEAEAEPTDEWPKSGAGGWWELSTGKKVRSEAKAREEQAKIEAE